MIERTHILAGDNLIGYDYLATPPESTGHIDHTLLNIANENESPAWIAYQRMHKVFVGERGGEYLEAISKALEQEDSPRLLDAAGWASAESALVRNNSPNSDRLRLLDSSEKSWVNSLELSRSMICEPGYEKLVEDSSIYRTALNIAYIPIMKAIVDGGITEPVQEQTFADTLAIAQASSVQLNLAEKSSNTVAIGDHLGFLHECNALLSLLYRNDPRYVPLPSSSRAGSGYFYREQTHDISLINQHWGRIKKIIPIEIKARASRNDRLRYKALLVRGKMHLSIEGKTHPTSTLSAFGAVYDGVASEEESKTVEYVSDTVHELLRLYQKGGDAANMRRMDTPTRFHGHKVLFREHNELSPDRIRQVG